MGVTGVVALAVVAGLGLVVGVAGVVVTGVAVVVGGGVLVVSGVRVARSVCAAIKRAAGRRGWEREGNNTKGKECK